MKTLRYPSALVLLFSVAALEARAGELTVSPTLVDFGQVAIFGPPASTVITLTNTGTDTFVSGLLSGGCNSIGTFAPFPALLGNGQSMQIQVSFDPILRGPTGCFFTVQDNDPNVDSFQVTGVGTAPAVDILFPPFPQALLFADQPWDGGTAQMLAVQFENVGNQPIQQADFFADLDFGDDFSVELPDFPIPAGASAAVLVTFDPASEGLKLDQLHLGLHNGIPNEIPATVTVQGFGSNTTGVEPLAGPIGLQLLGRNPVNETTRLAYAIPGAGRVKLGVFDMAGRLVRLLVDRTEDAGRHEVAWSRGSALPSGVYAVRFSFEGRVLGVKRVVVLK